MIQIIRGVYGYLDGDGIVRPKTEDDGPFTLMPDQEERLVRLGVAQYVGFVNQTPEPADLEEAVGSIELDEELEEERPLSEYSVKELREVGKDYGLTFKVGATKADMIRAIEEAEAELEAEDADDEDAPTFDAAEAVQ
jgi:hypothetical protein